MKLGENLIGTTARQDRLADDRGGALTRRERKLPREERGQIFRSQNVYSSVLFRLDHDFLTAQQEKECLTMTDRKSEDAALTVGQERLVMHNLKLVVSIVKKYMPRSRRVQFVDMFQEGVFGLFRAAQKYDGSYRFTTYATWWIHNFVGRHRKRFNYVVSVPAYVAEKDIGIWDCSILPAAESKHGKAMGVGITEEGIAHSVIRGHRYQMTKDFELDGAQVLLSKLNPRYRDVIERRFGLNDRKKETLEEIGQTLNVTRERIRQIEAKALRNLREIMEEAEGEAVNKERALVRSEEAIREERAEGRRQEKTRRFKQKRALRKLRLKRELRDLKVTKKVINSRIKELKQQQREE